MEKQLTNRWVVVAATMVFMVCTGAVYIWGVFQGPLMKQFGWNQSTAAFTFSLNLAVFAIANVFGGMIQDKHGPKKVALVSAILMGVGVGLAYFTTADRPWWIYLTYGVIGGAGIGAVYTTGITTCVKWFPDRKGLITGLVVCTLGAGGLLFTPLAKMWIAAYGPLETLAIFGGIFIVSGLIASQFIVAPPAGYKPPGWTPPAPGTVAVSARDYTTKEMVGTPQYYGLFIIMLAGCAAGMMIIPFAKILGIQAGLTEAVATSAVMIISAFNAMGRLGWGAASDKLGRKATLIVLLVVAGITMFFINSLQGMAVLVGIGVIAVCYGGFLGVIPAVVADYFGTKNMGMNYGMVLLSFGVAAIAGPMITARIKDATGDFHTAFLIGSIACIVTAGIAFLLKPPATNTAPVTPPVSKAV